MEEIKGFFYGIIPLGITIAIMVTTWNGDIGSFGNIFNSKSQNTQEFYRINDYQNHEPIISGGGLYWSDGGYYIGEYSDNKENNPNKLRNGFGVMYYPDGCVLTGSWKNGIVEGIGIYDCNEGIYSGEFKNNKINGKGVLMNEDNSFYSGEWLNEEPHGYGIIKYVDGESYEGYRVNGSKEGTGKYTWNDGTVYEGQFVKGKKSGRGKLIHLSGDIKEGIRENDEFKEIINTGEIKNEAD